jgi:hypothetical protein
MIEDSRARKASGKDTVVMMEDKQERCFSSGVGWTAGGGGDREKCDIWVVRRQTRPDKQQHTRA